MKNILTPIIVLLVVVLAFWFISKTKNTNEPLNININQESNTEQQNQELQIETLQEGEGEKSQNGDTLSVHYTGTLENGTKFDSSLDRGIPFEFTLGAGQVIEGWEQGMLGMRVGEKRKLTIPAHLAYGAISPSPAIPANSTLIFEVELLSIN